MEFDSLAGGGVYTVDAVDAFNKYSNMVYRLAFARTKNTHDSDDILQEVFLRLMKSKTPVQSDEHLKALLIRITINCSKSLLTSSWFQKTEPLNDTLESVSEKHDETFDAVMKLGVKYRTVIHLYYYCGYSINEIADILQCGVSAIKTRLSRARNLLKEELEGVDF